MKRFNFNKPMVESPYPPKDTNVLWVDVNESTGKVANIKKFLRGEWVDYLVFVPEPEIPEPVVGPADNEIWYSTVDHVAHGPLNAAGLTGDDEMTVEILPYDMELDRGVLRFSKKLSELRCQIDRYGDSASCFSLSISTISLPNSVTSIGSYAFYYCSSLTNIVIPNSVTSIGFCAFTYCTALTEITIPEGVESIGDSAFRGCSSLTSIVIPDSVTSIGDSAFRGCSSLTSIVIPNSVKRIGFWAFKECSVLTSITFEGTIEQWNSIDKGTDWNYEVPATYVQCSDGQVEL